MRHARRDEWRWTVTRGRIVLILAPLVVLWCASAVRYAYLAGERDAELQRVRAALARCHCTEAP